MIDFLNSETVPTGKGDTFLKYLVKLFNQITSPLTVISKSVLCCLQCTYVKCKNCMSAGTSNSHVSVLPYYKISVYGIIAI